jgi:hypothetical protein
MDVWPDDFPPRRSGGNIIVRARNINILLISFSEKVHVVFITCPPRISVRHFYKIAHQFIASRAHVRDCGYNMDIMTGQYQCGFI